MAISKPARNAKSLGHSQVSGIIHAKMPTRFHEDPEKNGRSGIRLPMDSSALLQSTYPLRLRAASLLYTLWVGDGEWEDMAETNPYRICWRSWRVAIRKGFFLPVDSLAKPTREAERLHLSYTLRSGMENGKT